MEVEIKEGEEVVVVEVEVEEIEEAVDVEVELEVLGGGEREARGTLR